MEINWFSNWKDVQPRAQLFFQIKDFHDLNNSSSYIKSSKQLIELMLNEFAGGKFSSFDLDRSLKLLSDFELPEEIITEVSSILSYNQGDLENVFPEYSKLEKLLARLDANMNLSPADLSGKYNPMYSMSDILRFNENKISRKNEIKEINQKFIPQLLANKDKIRAILMSILTIIFLRHGMNSHQSKIILLGTTKITKISNSLLFLNSLNLMKKKKRILIQLENFEEENFEKPLNIFH